MNQITPLAQEMARMGRGDDTMLAHISPEEAYLLRMLGGSGTTNPYTGLPEYFRIRMPKFIRQLAPVVAIAVPFLAPAIIPAIGASVLSAVGATTLATSAVATAAAGAAVVAGTTTLITTGSLEDAVKTAAVAAIAAPLAGAVGSSVSSAVTEATGSAIVGQIAGSAAGSAASAIATGRDPVEAAANGMITAGLKLAPTALDSLTSVSTPPVSAPIAEAPPVTVEPPVVPSAFESAVSSAVTPPTSPLGSFGNVGTGGFGSALPPVDYATSGLIAAGLAPGTAANIAGETAAGVGAPTIPASISPEPAPIIPEPAPIAPAPIEPPVSPLASVSTDAEAQPGGFYGESPLASVFPVAPPVAEISPIAPSVSEPAPAVDLGESFGDMTGLTIPEVGYPTLEPAPGVPIDTSPILSIPEVGFPMTEPITPAPADIIPGYATPENVFEYGFPETVSPVATPSNVLEYGFPEPETPFTPAPADVIPGYATPENVFEYGFPQTEAPVTAPLDLGETYGDVLRDISPGIEGFGEAADQVGGALSGTYVPGIEGFGEAADEVGGAGVTPGASLNQIRRILDAFRNAFGQPGGAGGTPGTSALSRQDRQNLVAQGLSMLGGASSRESDIPGISDATYLPGAPMSDQQQFLIQLKQLYPQLSGVDDRLLSTINAKVGGHIPEFITGKTGYYVQGRGDGQSDDIPAMLADGEYVFDADTVAALGNGSNKAGAALLDKMRENIRKHKRSAPTDKIPPKAKSPLAYLKG